MVGCGASECRDADQIATTDDDGRFRYAGLAICGFRVIRGAEGWRVAPAERVGDEARLEQGMPIRVVTSGAIDRVIVQLGKPEAPSRSGRCTVG